MNFRDAAIKVLTEYKKPLHYKKITSIALDGKMVDRVGNNPEKRMLDMLKIESQKNNSSIMSLKPGFFILKKYFDKNRRKKFSISETERKLYEFQKRNSKNNKKDKQGEKEDNFENISEFSKQIFDKKYFTDKKITYLTKKKQDIPEILLKKMEQKGDIKYYNVQDCFDIVKNDKIFDTTGLKPYELLSIIKSYNDQKFQKIGKKTFLIEDSLISPFKLLQSEELSNMDLTLKKYVKERDYLFRKDLYRWLQKLTLDKFSILLKQIFYTIGFQDFKVIEKFPQYFIVSKKMGISTLNFLLFVKRATGTISKHNIIEFRGMLPRFGYSNGILLTTSFFDDIAIDEASLTTNANIMLMDRAYLINVMIENGIGVKKDSYNQNYIDHNYFLTIK